MHRTLLLTASAVCGVALAASAETRTYDVPGFSGIDVSSGIDLSFEAGPEQSVVAETEKGDFDKLIIEVDGDDLVVRRARSGWSWGRNRDKFVVTVTGPAIDTLDASSGSSATANGFTGDYIQISASSGASVRASDVAGDEVELDASSGASLAAAGQCNRTRIDTSSGSSVSAGSLECAEVFADSSSGSSVGAYASERVVAEASSGASVTVRGGATNVDIDKSSGGSVSVS